MFETKAQRLAAILEAVPEDVAVPESAVRDLRGARTQAQIALKSGISQAMISDLEAGRKELTPATAAKLGPALGVSAAELQAAESVSRLQRVALKGQLDPQRLLESIMDLSFSLPDSQVADELVDALLAVLKKALATYDEHEKAAAKLIATKSKNPETAARPEGTRTPLGVQRRKLYGGGSR